MNARYLKPCRKFSPFVFRIVLLLLLLLQVSHARTSIAEQHRWLDSISPLPQTAQVDSLERYISVGNPADFLYELLLQRYLMLDGLSRAEQYFRQLALQHQKGAHAYRMLAKLYLCKNDPQSAARAYRSALDIETPSWKLIDDIFAFNQRFTDYAIAFRVVQNHFSAIREQGFVSALADYHRGKYRDVISALAPLEKEGILPQLLCFRLGDAYTLTSQHALAQAFWEKYIHVLHRDRNDYYAAILLEKLGANHSDCLKDDLAIVYYDSAMVLAKSHGNFELQQRILGNKAASLRFMNRYDEAIAHFKQAVNIATRLRAPLFCFYWYHRLGEISFSESRYDESLQLFEKAKEAAVEARFPRGIANILMEFGDAYSYMHLYELAEKAYEEAYRVADENGISSYLTRIKGGLGTIAEARGDTEAAIRAYHSVIEKTSSQRHLAYWHSRLGELYFRSKAYDLANYHHNQQLILATATDYLPYVGWSSYWLGETARCTGDFSTALQYFEKAENVADSLGHYMIKINVLRSMGDMHRDMGDLTLSLRKYRQAAQVTEQANSNLKVEELRIGHFDIVGEVYERLADTYFEQSQLTGNSVYLDSLFFFKSYSQGRSLRLWQRQKREESSGNAVADTSRMIYDRLCRQLRMQQRELRKLAFHLEPDPAMDTLLAKAEATRYSILAQQLNLNNIVTNEDSRSARAAENSPLAGGKPDLQGGALLMYHISERTTFVLTLAGDSLKAVPLPATRQEIEASVQQLLAPFHSIDASNIRETPFYAGLAHRLYEVLFEPVAQTMVLPEQIIIVPDLPITNLPFSLLLTEAPAQAQYTPTDSAEYAGNFLVNFHTFSYTPTPAFLTRPASFTTLDSPQVLAFANPFNAGTLRDQLRSSGNTRIAKNWYFPPLPYAQHEAEKIRELYENTKIVSLDQATLNKMLDEASGHQILHFATHGFIDPDFEAFSGLVFAFSEDDSTDDGLLLGYEIADLNFQKDLITLSACETGRGKLIAGEGVLGLPRMFLNAGAQSIIMTHWKVDDYFSAQIMPSFYDNYLNQNLTKTAALTRAQRDVLQNSQPQNGIFYQHPVFWSAYALYGHPGRAGKDLPWQWLALAALTAVAGGWLLRRFLHI